MNPGKPPRSSPGAPTLILVPTALERTRLEALGGLPPGAGLLELCGFGPVAAAARSAELLARIAPRRVVLIGIAGSFDPERFPVGRALRFGSVALEGVGAGEGEGLLASGELGLAQWTDSDGAITDRLPLEASPGDAAHGLLTVCAASGDARQARRRAQRWAAAAEDMEAFGVALACRMAQVPLSVVRGLSNRAGERDVSGWAIDPALDAARTLTHDLLGLGPPA